MNDGGTNNNNGGGGPPPPWDDVGFDETTTTTNTTTTAAMAQWRERERRQRTVRLLMMFLLMLLLMDGEEQSTRRRKDSLMRKGRNNGSSSSSSTKKTNNKSSSSLLSQEPNLFHERIHQEERLEKLIQQHERYHTLLIEKNHDIDVDSEIRSWAIEQDELRKRKKEEEEATSTNKKKKNEEETDDDEDDTIVFHYPWNATGFYRGEWVRQDINDDDDDGDAKLNQTKMEDAVPQAVQHQRVAKVVLSPSEMEVALKDMMNDKDVMGVQLLPPGHVLALDNLTKVTEAHINTPGTDELRRRKEQQQQRLARRSSTQPNGLFSLFQKVVSPELNVVVDNAKDDDEEDDNNEDLIVPKMSLQKSRGRAAFQLFSRSVPAMKEISLVDGFCKLYDSTTVGYSTGRDVLLRVRGVLIHSIGRLSLVSNASPGRSAMIVGRADGGSSSSTRTSRHTDDATTTATATMSTTTSSSPPRKLTKRSKQEGQETSLQTNTTTRTTTPTMSFADVAATTDSSSQMDNDDDTTTTMTKDQRRRLLLLEEEVSQLNQDSTKMQVDQIRDVVLQVHSNLDVVKDQKNGWRILVDDNNKDENFLDEMTNELLPTAPASLTYNVEQKQQQQQQQQQQRHLNDIIQSDDEVTDDIVEKVPPVQGNETPILLLDLDDDNNNMNIINRTLDYGEISLVYTEEGERRTLEEEEDGIWSNEELNETTTIHDVDDDDSKNTITRLNDVIYPFPFVPDDSSGTIRKHKTPVQRKMPPFEQALEENARHCEFEIMMNVRPEEWTRNSWKNLLNRKQYEVSKLNPKNQHDDDDEEKNHESDSTTSKRKHSSASKSSSSSSNNVLEKPMQDQAWVMLMTGTIHSPNCGFTSSLNVTAIRTDWEHRTGKAINYSFYMMLTCLTQIVVLLRQLLHTQAQSTATRVSLLCIGWQTVLDALLCLGHIYLSLAMQPLFTAFASVAFFKLLIFCVIEMKYMAIIIQARNSSNGGQTTTEVLRRQVAMLHLRFYVALVGAFLAFFYANHDANYRTMYVLLLYSFWIPQIIQNIITEAKQPLHYYYIYGMSLTRCIAPIYIFAISNNFLYPDAPTNYKLVQLLLLWVGIQTAVLVAQSKYGARFMIPSRFLPPKFDYSRPIPPSLLPPEVLRDVQELQSKQEEQQRKKTQNSIQLRTSQPTSSSSNEKNGGKRGGGGTRNRRQKRKNAAATTCIPTSGNSVVGGTTSKTSLMIADDFESIPKRPTMLDCVICCNGIDVLNRSAYMLAPCDHIFHRDCLVQWMDVKMECPVCRKELPTI